VMLCTEAQADDDSLGQRLLADVRTVLDAQGLDIVPSADLAAAIAAIETAPWGEWSRGKPLTAAKLARMLGKFGIKPDVIRVGEKTHRGYTAPQFQDAFYRYLRLTDAPPPVITPSQSVTTQQTNADAGSSDITKCNGNSEVTLSKCVKPAPDGPSYVVTLLKPGTGAGERPATCATTCYEIEPGRWVHRPWDGCKALNHHIDHVMAGRGASEHNPNPEVLP
jgi:hypothetical protein